MQGLQGDLPQALLRFFETLTGSHAMQGSQGVLVVIIIAAAAFLAGLYRERLRARLARQAWHKRKAGWRRGEGVPFKAGWRRGEGVPFKTGELQSLTQQNSFASSWVQSLKSAPFSHGQRLRSCTPPKGRSTLRTSTGV